jgi:2-oxoglutarate ferredoxin oxidoreductase subunit alpha
MQSRWGTHGDHPIIVVAPSSVEECFTETVRAFNLAERYRTPVIVLSDEMISHLREAVELPGEEELEVVGRARPEPGQEGYLPFRAGPNGVPLIADLGSGYRFHITGLVHDETGFPSEDPEVVQALLDRLHAKVEDNLTDIVKCEEHFLEGARIGIVAFGCTARSAYDAVQEARERDLPVGLLKLLTLWPFPEERVAILGKRMRLLVPELNRGQLVREVERVAGDVVRLNRYDGELITPRQILEAAEAML